MELVEKNEGTQQPGRVVTDRSREIIERYKALPADMMRQVEDFVEFLHQKAKTKNKLVVRIPVRSKAKGARS